VSEHEDRYEATADDAGDFDDEHPSGHADEIETVDGEPSRAPRWTEPEPTGVPAVDETVAELAELDQLPTGEHVAVYDASHRRLQDALADLDGA
jgi:hypothetical protein